MSSRICAVAGCRWSGSAHRENGASDETRGVLREILKGTEVGSWYSKSGVPWRNGWISKDSAMAMSDLHCTGQHQEASGPESAMESGPPTYTITSFANKPPNPTPRKPPLSLTNSLKPLK